MCPHPSRIENDLPLPLISAEDIAQRVAALGREIAATLPPGPIHVIAVLRGAFVFAADLVRAMPRDVRCDFLAVRSYGSATESSGIVEITHDIGLPITGQQVLLVEDIVDTGLTIRHLLDLLSTRHPASVHVCTLLSKPSRRSTEVPVHFVGFEIADHFVVGYGLDHDQRYRNLPHVGILAEPSSPAP
ncbi:MAG: hypoxanthine phosphoribosyltransferase [Deltaproteobacteria bacterium]|jgi:hypoxanthine phosphoribosyltransferase|nr:hypoxanthine phosphoribosyltransferase [Deltaproteobacteria bacterium]